MTDFFFFVPEVREGNLKRIFDTPEKEKYELGTYNLEKNFGVSNYICSEEIITI